MSFNQKEIGRRVKELRTGHQLSLDQLADAVNCTRDHLYRAERGEARHGFSIDILIDIAEYFEVSLDSAASFSGLALLGRSTRRSERFCFRT